MDNLLNIHLFGHTFRTGHPADIEKHIHQWIDQGSGESVCLAHHNLHSLALCRKDDAMQSYMDQSALIWLDGMPMITMLRALGHPVKRSWRTTFLDWDNQIFKQAHQHQWRVFLLGTSKDNINTAHQQLHSKYPNVKFSSHHGYLTQSREPGATVSAINKINEFNTDLLLVGMGMPTQEQWILDNSFKLKAKVIMPIGGYFDYIANATPTPPRFLGNIGLEWAYRLFKAPSRLGYRYLIEPWPVIGHFLLEVIKYRLWENDDNP